MQEESNMKIQSLNMFDEVEIVHNCTVQILRNSSTGEVSISWWPEDNPPAGIDM